MEKEYALLKPPPDSPYVGLLEKTIKQLGAIPDWPESPADEFAKLPTKDVTKQMSSMPDSNERGAGTNDAAADIRGYDQVSFDCPDGDAYDFYTYSLYALGPAGHDVKLSARCHFQDAGKQLNFWEKCVKIGISPREPGEKRILMDISDSGRVQVAGAWNPPYSLDLGPAIIKGFNVTVIAIGQRCEIDVNKKRIFYGPILAPPDTRQLRLIFIASGVKGALTNVVWKIDKPDTGQ
jgi:hypothetical protein